jgi:hypothetical protein
MARRRQETDDEITEADDTAGAAIFGGSSLRGTRQVKVKDAGDLLLLRDWPLAPVSTRTRAFGGLNHLEGFLLLPSEGYNISKARTCSMADLLLLRNFLLCIRYFLV